MGDWFTTESLDGDTYVLSEDRHWEHTHCYLLNGSARSLLIDTGLGIGDLNGLVRDLTDRPVVAVATHAHWDHIGGHSGFPCFYVHEAEQKWLDGAFPLPLAQVRAMVADCDSLPRDFRPETYTIFQGTPNRVLQDGDEIDLGAAACRCCIRRAILPATCAFGRQSGDTCLPGTWCTWELCLPVIRLRIRPPI